MKKIIAIVLTIIMILSVFAGCGTKEETSKATEEATTETASVTEKATEAPATEEPTPEITEEPEETEAAATEEPVDEGNLEFNIPYVTDGLVALYEGYMNTRKGNDTSADYWDDLSGNKYDLCDLNALDYEWKENGLYVEAAHIELPEEIFDLINSDEFSIEISIDDFNLIGCDYATILNNSGNDYFSLFVRVGDDALEVKANAQRPRAAQIGGGTELVNNSTVTVTFESLEKICLYVDGELISEVDAPECFDITGHFFIGHDTEAKSWSGVISSLRFYDRVLEPEEVKANSDAKGTLTVKEAE